ncbi:hypothetical protein V6N12_017267 [Hibiscus sabdariffa]|uniref:Uncharacterized protein n=1 Tax=Hibiscus sabdariffa TaxID=183260 RepID=A0ABR2CF16_9ROSI
MNLIDDSGLWDTDKLAEVFTTKAIQYIMSIKPPIQGDITDSCYWRWTSKHDFELKSTYNKQVELTWEIANPIWNTIWSLQVSSSPDSALAKSIIWARYYHEGWQIQKPNTIANATQSCWQHPEPGWLCLNVDRSVSSGSGCASIDDLLRDHLDNWIFGFTKSIEKKTSSKQSYGLPTLVFN